MKLFDDFEFWELGDVFNFFGGELSFKTQLHDEPDFGIKCEESFELLGRNRDRTLSELTTSSHSDFAHITKDHFEIRTAKDLSTFFVGNVDGFIKNALLFFKKKRVHRIDHELLGLEIIRNKSVGHAVKFLGQRLNQLEKIYSFHKNLF